MTTETPLHNHLLNALPAPNYDYLHPYFEQVWLPCGEVLHEFGEKLLYGYFPTTCVVSMQFITENGAIAEVAMIGKEGMLGIPLVMGGGAMPNRAVVVVAGYAYRLRAHQLKREFLRSGGERSGALQQLTLRYALSLMTYLTQTAACNRHHSIAQQLCRYLLQTLDRLNGNEIVITQAIIANLLGVRREGITEAAGKLQRAGAIRYSRGHITVLDRAYLEAQTCECYPLIKRQFELLIPEALTNDPNFVDRQTIDNLAWKNQCYPHAAIAGSMN